ncbi:hypothetical protein DRJ48_02515 [Candidatus Woesearchaeota archaeon]|nr:hypothetical protein [Candidatus Woesearchaeota archaeon]RLE42857.1 MAG: hypothetical protein DRJ48_02515 [Candidatus Woesearchaeota archaeon]
MGYPILVLLSLSRGEASLCLGLYDPFYEELFVGERGKGAFLNNKQIKVSDVTQLSRSLLCIGIHTRGNANLKHGLSHFRKLLEVSGAFRRIGSTALEICYVACGRVEAHINNNSDIHAIPAAKVILEEAGGKLTDFYGHPWDPNAGSVVASNGHIHKELVALLRDI